MFTSLGVSETLTIKMSAPTGLGMKRKLKRFVPYDRWSLNNQRFFTLQPSLFFFSIAAPGERRKQFLNIFLHFDDHPPTAVPEHPTPHPLHPPTHPAWSSETGNRWVLISNILPHFLFKKTQSSLHFLHPFTGNNDVEMKSSEKLLTQIYPANVLVTLVAKWFYRDLTWTPRDSTVILWYLPPLWLTSTNSLPSFAPPGCVGGSRSLGVGFGLQQTLNPPLFALPSKGLCVECEEFHWSLSRPGVAPGRGYGEGTHVLGTTMLPETGHRATTLLWESRQNENTRGRERFVLLTPSKREPALTYTYQPSFAPPNPHFVPTFQKKRSPAATVALTRTGIHLRHFIKSAFVPCVHLRLRQYGEHGDSVSL